MEYIDLEIIENMIEDEQKARNAGYIDKKHLEEHQIIAAHGMKEFGNTFVKQLGIALESATLDDAIKIFRTWYNECETHALLFEMKIAKEKALKKPESH